MNVAMQLCKGRDARVTVVHVSEYGPMPAITKERLDQSSGYLKGAREPEERS